MTDSMTPERILALRDAATPGPWASVIVSDDEDYADTFEARGQPDIDGWANVVASCDDHDDARLIAATPAICDFALSQAEALADAQADYRNESDQHDATVMELATANERADKAENRVLRHESFETILWEKGVAQDEALVAANAENARLREAVRIVRVQMNTKVNGSVGWMAEFEHLAGETPCPT